MQVLDLLQWWNLIFVLPFCLALGTVLLMATGAVSAEMGDHDVDLDFDLDADVDVDADVGADTDHHFDLHEATGEGSFLSNALSLLGVGKAPLSLIGSSFCFIWGFTGWAANQFFQSLWPAPAVFAFASIGVALFSAIFLTRFIVLGLAKLMPLDENFAVSDSQLVGRRATVRFSVTNQSGTAQVYDQYGTLHEVPCRLKGDESEGDDGERNEQNMTSLPPGTPIILMEWNREQKFFRVRTDPLGNPQLPRDPPKMMT
jgi:hypothetical protein